MTDDRTYIKLHDGICRHPKVVGLSDKAFRAYIEALCYCSEYLTDGQIVKSFAAKIASRRVWAEMAACGLVDVTDSGYAMHDYLEHQRSADQVKQFKEAKRKAGSKGGRAKAAAVAGASPVATNLPEQTPSNAVPETESLTYVRDQTASNSSLRSAQPANSGPKNAGQIVGDWIDTLDRRPPSAVIGHVSKQVKALLGEKFTVAEVETGLAAWQAKGLHPSVLPSIVNETVNKPKAARKPLDGPVDHSGAGRKQQVLVGGDNWRDVSGDEVTIGRKTRWVSA